MKKRTLIAILFSILTVQGVRAELITSPGKHAYQDSNVVIDISGTKPTEMNFTMVFDLPQFKGQTGTGKGSPMNISSKNWAAQFVAPNQLWIFDGLGKLTLFERTIEPNGFKGSDSEVIPTLMANAPEELRLFMTLTTLRFQTKPIK